MDFKTAVSSTLGFDLSATNGALLSFNVDALQGVIFAIIRKLQESQTKIERLEYELESKCTKSEIFTIREKIKGIPSTEDFAALNDKIDSKLDRSEINSTFETIQEVKDRQTKLEQTIRSKSNKQDIDLIQGQLSYMQESLKTQEIEVQNIRKLRQQINNIANQSNGSGGNATMNRIQSITDLAEKPEHAPLISVPSTESSQTKLSLLSERFDQMQNSIQLISTMTQKNTEDINVLQSSQRDSVSRSHTPYTTEVHNHLHNNITNANSNSNPSSNIPDSGDQVNSLGVEYSPRDLNENANPNQSHNNQSNSTNQSGQSNQSNNSNKNKPNSAAAPKRRPETTMKYADDTKIMSLMSTMQSISSNLDNTNRIVDAQQKEIEKLQILVGSDDLKENDSSSKLLRSASESLTKTIDDALNSGEINSDRGFVWSKEDMELLQNNLKMMLGGLEAKATKKSLLLSDQRISKVEESIYELSEVIHKKPDLERIVDVIMEDPKFKSSLELACKNYPNPDLLIDIERLTRKISALKDETSSTHNTVIEMQKAAANANNNSPRNVKKNNSRPSTADKNVEEPLASPKTPKTFDKSDSENSTSGTHTLKAVRNRQITDDLDGQSKDIKTLYSAVRELSDLIEEKADLKILQELEDKREQMNEILLQIQADMQQKADKVEAQMGQELKKISVDFQDLRDDTVLKNVIEDITNNLNILFKTKADTIAVQKSLAEKGDQKVLAAKANRSYVEALVERLNKTTNNLVTKVDSLQMNSNSADIGLKIEKLKKVVAGKIDRNEMQQLMRNQYEQEVATQSSNEEGRVTKKQILYCLSCDRPVGKKGNGGNNIPLMPSALPSTHNRGSYDADYYRKERKRATSPSYGQKLAAQFRQGLIPNQTQSLDDDLVVEPQLLQSTSGQNIAWKEKELTRLPSLSNNNN